MVVVVHQNVGMQEHGKPPRHLGHLFAEMLPIALRSVNGTPFFPACRNVVPTSHLFDSERTRHVPGACLCPFTLVNCFMLRCDPKGPNRRHSQDRFLYMWIPQCNC